MPSAREPDGGTLVPRPTDQEVSAAVRGDAVRVHLHQDLSGARLCPQRSHGILPRHRYPNAKTGEYLFALKTKNPLNNISKNARNLVENELFTVKYWFVACFHLSKGCQFSYIFPPFYTSAWKF